MTTIKPKPSPWRGWQPQVAQLLQSAKDSVAAALWPRHGVRRTLDLPCESKAGFGAFRSSATPLPPSKRDALPSTVGLAQLRISGSSEFTPEGLKSIRASVPADYTFLDIDIRQESHGYDGTRALGWWKENNSGNAKKTLSQVYRAEAAALAALNQLPRGAEYVAYQFDTTESIGDKVELRAHTAYNEATLARNQGVAYARIPMTDRAPYPSDASVDRFVDHLMTLDKNTWVHFHCLHGHGRTTLYMVMYDMLRNAHRVSADDIIQRQFLIGGVDLRRRTETVLFLQRFHAYARVCLAAVEQGKQVPVWSNWLAKLTEHQTLLRFIEH